MKTFKSNILVFIGVLLFSSNAFSQFTLSGEIRPRLEIRNGFKKPHVKDVDPAAFIEQRSRLYFNYKSDKVLFNMSVQDVRIWGSVDQIYKADTNLMNVFEAWGQYNFNENFAFRAGRMALAYDNHRFLGSLGWAAQSRSHDALLLKYASSDKSFVMDFGLAYNQNWAPEHKNLAQNFYNQSVTNNYKTMQFVWLNKKIEGGKLSWLIHNDGRQLASDSSMVYRLTAGMNGSKSFGNVTVGGEFYYQGGKNGGGKDLSALMAGVYATYKTDLTPITIGADYMSGTSVGDTKDKSFNPLYGTNHKFYGFMDYFYVGNGHQNVGLIDVHLKTNFKFSEKSSLVVNVHNFTSPTNLTWATTQSLGTEIDLVYNLALAKDVKINLGYSQMFATDTMVGIKGGDNTVANNWAWAMVLINPTLFTSQKEE